MLPNLFTGILVGFFVAIPIGPIDMLCIRRSLLWGAQSGFITGLGAACADAIYGAAAAFGVITFTAFLIGYKLFFQIIGGLILCYLGLKLFRINEISETKGKALNSLPFAFMTTFLLALLSPMTILSFMGAYTVLGVGNEGENAALPLTLGVFMGSALWWLILSHGVAIFRNKLNLNNLKWINRCSGAILISFGLTALWLAFIHFEYSTFSVS